MADDFPEIALSYTTKNNKRISYQSRRFPGHIFSFSAGSRAGANTGKPKSFECLACLAKKGRLKRALGAGHFHGTVARVKVSGDITKFVEDPETDAIISEHQCVQGEDAPKSRKAKEEIESSKTRQKVREEQVAKKRKMTSTAERARRRSSKRPSPEIMESESGSDSASERESKRDRTDKDQFPAITWSTTKNQLRQASYESPRFDGRVFRFREDATSKNRKRGNHPRVFECIDCGTLRSQKSRQKNAEAGGSARVKITADYKEFTEDPDYSIREHQCIALHTVSPLRANQRLSLLKIDDEVSVEVKDVRPVLIKEEPQSDPESEDLEESDEEPEEKVERLVLRETYKFNLKKNNTPRALDPTMQGRKTHPKPKQEPTWEELAELKKTHPYDYVDVFLAQQSNQVDMIDNYITLVHERFLRVVKENHPTSTLTNFSTEFEKWKEVFVSAAEKISGSQCKIKRPTSDEYAFGLVPKFLANGKPVIAAAMENKFDHIMIRVPFRSCVNKYMTFPRILIVGGNEHQTKYLAISRQMIPLPRDFPFSEILRLLVESYVAFDISNCPEVAETIVLLEFMYGVHRSQLSPDMQELFRSTYESLKDEEITVD